MGAASQMGSRWKGKEDDLEKRAFKLDSASCGIQQHGMEFCRECLNECERKREAEKLEIKPKTANLTLPCGFVILNT